MFPGVLLIRLLGLYVVVGFPVKEWGLGFLIPPSSDVKSAGHLSCLASEELGHGPTPLLLGDFSSCIYPKKKMAIWQAVTHTRGLFSIQTLNSSVLWRGRAGVSSTLAGCGSPWVCVQLRGRETGLFCPWQQGPKPVSLFGSAFAELKSWLLAAYISVSPNVRGPVPSPVVAGREERAEVCWPLDKAAGKPRLVWDHHFPHGFMSLVAVASVGKCWPHASGLRKESSSSFSFLEMLPVFFFNLRKGCKLTMPS